MLLLIVLFVNPLLMLSKSPVRKTKCFQAPVPYSYPLMKCRDGNLSWLHNGRTYLPPFRILAAPIIRQHWR
uniref:Putative secreted protein n=1 Tax=Ixodes scapularis TaxID=6945 RepID=A0A4D5RZ96_IXOSC